MRQTWDQTYMLVASNMSGRSSCERRRCGAVIVDATQRIVSTGYNGPPAGFPGSCRMSCERNLKGPLEDGYGTCISVHSELNALLFADRRQLEGGTIYVTSSVCWDCAKAIANSGLRRVVMRVFKEDAHRQPQRSIDFLRSCGLEVTVYQ
jgi:dCMP deaminase